MDNKSRQQALDNISPEDLEKIKAHQASTKGAALVDDYWLLLAEFTMYYGWQAYKDAEDIPLIELLTLVEAGRKLRAREIYENAQAVLIGTATANAGKRSGSTFKNLTRTLVKIMKADEE